MQKKLIAIAVAAALAPAAAMADTTVYGRIHTSIDSVTGVALNTNKLSVNSNSSRFGVKGSEDLGDGMKVLYQIESGVQANGDTAAAAPFNSVRDTYIGLTGGFGTFLAGRLPAANQYVYDSNLFADQLGDAANLTGAGLLGGRANSALHYVSPSMSGFNVALTYLPGLSTGNTLGMTTNVTATHGQNSYGIKLNYAANGITAGLTYFDVKVTGVNAAAAASANTVTTVKPMSLAASYDFGNGMVTAQYVKENTTDDIAGTALENTRKIYNIGGKFNVSSNSAIKAQYSHAGEARTNSTDGAKMFAVGYDYSFSKRTGMYVVYAATSNDTNGTFKVNGVGHQVQNGTPAIGEDPKGFGVGLTHNF